MFQLTRDAERQLLHSVNAAECEALIERWTSDDCREALVKFMQEQSAKAREKKKSQSAKIMAKSAPAPASVTGSVQPTGGFQSAVAFDEIAKRMATEGASMVKKVNCVYRFDLTSAEGAHGSWLIDLKSGNGVVRPCTNSEKADCMIAVAVFDRCPYVALLFLNRFFSENVLLVMQMKDADFILLISAICALLVYLVLERV